MKFLASLKSAARWLGFGCSAVIAFIIALILARRSGRNEGKAEEQSRARIEEIKEAGAKGDLETLDDVWRGRK